MNWTTKNTYVNEDTGEEIDRIQVHKGKYITIGKTIKHVKHNEYHGTKHIIHRVRKDNQTTIW